MSTAAVNTLSTKEIAKRYNELAQEGHWDKVQDELFASHAVSIEPPGAQGMKTVEGIDAIKQKGVDFQNSVEEVHGGYCSEPVVAANHFAVSMGLDATMKGMGRIKMDEIAVYEVKDGKIVSEQFFY